jgi:subtilisin family serine protease
VYLPGTVVVVIAGATEPARENDRMKPYRLSLLLALIAGACAPATPVETPTPASTPEPVEAVGSGEVDVADPASAGPAAGSVPATAPAAWWLADADAVSPGAGVERAYRELLADRAPARTVVVGVIDSGVEIAHEDLDENIWVNEDEVAGNGVDDDGNGYVDDVHGWNFIGGADGAHVNQDTYELTRLYARCREGVEVAGGGSAGIGTCAEIEREFEEDVRESRQQLTQIGFMATAVDRFVQVLRRELGEDSLTEEAVRGLTPMRMEVRQAQAAYLQLADAGITPAMVHEEHERLEDRLEYGLNPDFDPRGIVGDDYDDPTERVYGNADVAGPRAGHGTGVAGIIGAERGNGIGEDGIAPSVRIMVLRTVPDGDERDKDVANAIRYAVDNGADVINMSFGKGHSPRKDVVDAAVRYAVENGVLLVHAAGNDGADLGAEPSYPTRSYLDGGVAETWLSVGASSWEGVDRLAASFSNYGRPEVDVFAPGVDIHTTDVGNGFQTNSGTSFAAPVVSGLAALIMAYYPELDAAEVREVILDSARRYDTATVALPGAGPEESGETVGFGELSVTGGIVDAYAALELAAERAGAGR